MTAKGKFTKARHVSLRLSELKVHPKVQRRFVPTWARQIRDDFDPDKFREIYVVAENGKLLIFDGQHRWWAAKEALGAEQMVPCIVFDEMPRDRQAELFLGLNTVRAVSAIDKYKVAVVAGRVAESTVDAILHEAGLRVDQSRAAGTVRSPVALLKVHSRYGDGILGRALGIIKQAWHTDPDAFDGVIIRAVGFLLHHFPDEVDDEELSRKLTRTGGPSRLLGASRDHAKTMGISVERAAAERILNTYNKGRRTTMLSFSTKPQPSHKRRVHGANGAGLHVGA